MTSPYIHVPYGRIDEYLSFIREHLINLEIYFPSYSLDALKLSDIETLKGRLGYDARFTIHAPFMDLSPGAVDEKAREVTIDRFSRVLDIAEILRPASIVFHSGYEKWKYALKVEPWLEQSLKTWRQVMKRASDIGLKVAIENIFEDEPSNLRALMEEMGSKNFGICFDTGHFNLFSQRPLGEWLDQIGPYILEMHLHDNNKTGDDHLAIGEGSFDFDALFSRLEAREIIHTIEGHTPDDVLKSIDRLKKYV